MKLFETCTRRRVVGVLATVAVGAAVAGAVATPIANAAPCSASGLATSASGVLGEAGGYLDAHPGANDVLTAAADQPADQARSNVRGYFTAHPGGVPRPSAHCATVEGPAQPVRHCGVAE